MYTGMAAVKECYGSEELLGVGQLLLEVCQRVLVLGSAHDQVDGQGREVRMV